MAAHNNPVIPGFHPDPSVVRVGDEFFLATSSFTWAPGVPIFRSANLTDWTLIANALDRDSQLNLEGTEGWASLGIFAPTLRHHAGRFWMITTVSAGSRGTQNFFVTAEDPAGPWSDPVNFDVAGIDPDIAWDDEGRCWVHYSGPGSIMRCRIDDTTGELIDEPTSVWSGIGLQYPEAPHLYRIGGRWYLLIAEGGTERGHAVSIARSESPEGPWESCPHNPILSHRSTDRPVQNTGHADITQAADGSWWMVALGVRPQGMTPGFHVLGRETFLTAVTWENGWPFVSPIELEPADGPPGTTTDARWEVVDDFDDPTLRLEWLARRRQAADLADLTTRPGWLTITDDGTTLDDPAPSFLGCRQQHHLTRADTHVDLTSGRAGLAVVMDDHTHYRVEVDTERVSAIVRIGPVEQVLGQAPRPPGPTELVIETKAGALGPDHVSLGFRNDAGEWVELACPDGRYLSTEVTTGFIGRIIGVYASGGTAAFDRFRLAAADSGDSAA